MPPPRSSGNRLATGEAASKGDIGLCFGIILKRDSVRPSPRGGAGGHVAVAAFAGCMFKRAGFPHLGGKMGALLHDGVDRPYECRLARVGSSGMRPTLVRRWAPPNHTSTYARCQMTMTGSVDPRLMESLRWRCIGPPRGGRVVAAAGDPCDPMVFYFGAVGGGVWKTTDGGTYWEPVSDDYFNTAAVGALAVSESDPNVIYAGTGESCIRGNVTHGDGVYRSTDAGKTWKHVGLEDTRHIARVRVHPTNPDLVYVAALGHAFGPNEERGVFRSKDGGDTWEKVLYKSDKAGAIDLSLDASNPRIMYAAVWETLREPFKFTSGGPDSGLYKSTDGGDTWTDITCNQGLPEGDQGADRRRCLSRQAGAGLGDHRGREAGAVPVGRRRRYVGARQRRRQPAAAAVVLRPRIRRPAGREHLLRAEPEHVEVDGRGQVLREGNHASRRQPRAVDRLSQPEEDGPGQRRRRVRDLQRRRYLVDDLQPAHVAVLSPDHGRPVPLPGVRHPAGQQRDQRAEPHEHGGDSVVRLLRGWQLGERAHRGRPEGP